MNRYIWVSAEYSKKKFTCGCGGLIEAPSGFYVSCDGQEKQVELLAHHHGCHLDLFI